MLVNPTNVMTVEASGEPGRSQIRMTDGSVLIVHGTLDHLEEALSPPLAVLAESINDEVPSPSDETVSGKQKGKK